MQEKEEKQAQEKAAKPSVEEMIDATNTVLHDEDSGVRKLQAARGMKEVLCQILTRKRSG
jgi:hypothetical protein